MDPKFGEISRAMTNGGVEIYLLAVKLMLYNLILTRKSDQDGLMKIHRRVSHHLSTLEPSTFDPTLEPLTQSSLNSFKMQFIFQI